MKRFLSLCIAVSGILSPLFATTYTVNSLANTNTGAGTSGTLRWCVNQANLTVGPHLINFSVAGTIAISSDAVAIPALARSITIDATTAPGFAGFPVVILNGAGSISLNGLTISAASCNIYGLEIINFPYRGVYFSSSTVSSCNFGSSGKGNVVRANGYYGIQLNGSDNNILAYNRVGTSADGSTCSANGYDGIDLMAGADNNQILNNHIACNGYNGLQIGNSHFNIVKGNTIGPLTATCSSNGYRGVDIEGGSHDNVIGGTAAGEANKVSGNLYWGIEVKEAGSIRNIISGNSISCNDYGGIEINTGGNIGIAAPTITTATTTSVSGTSLANSIIEVFRAQDPALIICPMAPTPNNQGIDYLGTTTASAGGAWSLSGSFNGSIVATQRDAAGNTSRFSAAVTTGAAASFVSNCPGTIVLSASEIVSFEVSCGQDNSDVVQVFLKQGHTVESVSIEMSENGAPFRSIGFVNMNFGRTYAGTYHYWTVPGERLYRLALTSVSGELRYSQVQGLTSSACEVGEPSFTAYPVPAQGKLFIDLSSLTRADFFFTDMAGRKICNSFNHIGTTTRTAEMDISGMAPGVYILTCITDGRTLRQKVVVE